MVYSQGMKQLMKIYGFTPGSPFFLAPMAGVSDSAFRTICGGYGAAVTYSEMVSAKALTYNNEKTGDLLHTHGESALCIPQIFGRDPQIMVQGALIALEASGARAIDINMGCPAPKIVNNGEGSALMLEPALAAEIITAVVRAVKVPVSVKFRKGFFREQNIAADFAKMAEASGAAAICIHGRTREQMYAGVSDPDVIRDVKRSVKIPVIASGDAMSPEGIMKILEYTGADFIAIARGALGNPMIFRDCLALYGGADRVPPTRAELLSVMKAHCLLAIDKKGEKRALPEMRKHILWYLDMLRKSKPYKVKMSVVSSKDEFMNICQEIENAGLPLKNAGQTG